MWSFDLTFSEFQKPGNAIGQYPGVTAELEQVIWENVDKSEAEPVRNETDELIEICEFCLFQDRLPLRANGTELLLMLFGWCSSVEHIIVFNHLTETYWHTYYTILVLYILTHKDLLPLSISDLLDVLFQNL